MAKEYDPDVPLAQQIDAKRTYDFEPMPEYVLGVLLPPPEQVTELIVAAGAAQERLQQGQIEQCPIVQVVRAGQCALDCGIEVGKCYTFIPRSGGQLEPHKVSLHLFPEAFVGLDKGVFAVHYSLLMLETTVFEDGDIVLPKIPKALELTKETE